MAKQPSHVTFTVDTHLFRELGALLVGRDSTALIELVKNAYDADATEVVVFGESLDNAFGGTIVITDNGIGMSRDEFQRGFLRIAGRVKDKGERRSLVFQRRYTGAKGVGRLAAHKLAALLQVSSRRWNGREPSVPQRSRRTQAIELLAGSVGIEAVIDWNEVERHQTLDQLGQSSAIILEEVDLPSGTHSGTVVTLKHLRRKWTSSARAQFLEEMQTFEPPRPLVLPIPSSVVSERLLLLDEPLVRDSTRSSGQQFQVKLEGAFTPEDSFWTAVLEAANWVIEIDASEQGSVRYAIAPTQLEREATPDAKVKRFKTKHPSPHDGPFFQARILVRTGQRRHQAWRANVGGIRVYLEGFRVLPYGEPRNDWLGLDRDYTSREKRLLVDVEAPLRIAIESTDQGDTAGLLRLPNKQFFGAVFLTQNRAQTLRLLVNREGFVPEQGYETLVTLVRTGIHLFTRVRAAATVGQRAERARIRAGVSSGGDDELQPLSRLAEAIIKDLETTAAQARHELSGGDVAKAASSLERLADRASELSNLSEMSTREASMLRVLASMGTQLAGFTHEINGLVTVAAAVDLHLDRLRKSREFPARVRKELALIHRRVSDLRRIIERQASYLVDVTTPDARRRRSRQSLAERFDSAHKLVAHAAEVRSIEITNAIPEDLRSPPMFPAELTAVFSNLLTNGVKAAGRGGHIHARATRDKEGTVTIFVENTGRRVPAGSKSERWFRPFESSTTKIDTTLGQGMGLGLTITRSILEEYGAKIKFGTASAGFSTALLITFPS